MMKRHAQPLTRGMKVFLIGSIIVGGLGIGSAQATVDITSDIGRKYDRKTYPGAACQDLSGGKLTYTKDGTIRNNTYDQWIDVVCPITRDLSESKYGGMLKVKVHDWDTVESKMRCSVQARGKNGLNYNAGEKKSGTGVGSAFYWNFYMWTGGNSENALEKGGHSWYVLNCSIGPKRHGGYAPAGIDYYIMMEQGRENY